MNKPRTLLLIFCSLAMSGANARSQQPPAAADRWEAEVRKFEEADRKSPPPKGAVLFIGSSSIRLWESLAQDFPDAQVINRGFGGSQISDSTSYADRIVAPYEPRMIVLYAGDNDLAGGKTPERVFEDYKAFVRRVREKLPRAKIAYLSIKPSPARAPLMQKMRAANELIRGYTAGGNNLIYIDVFTPMLGGDGQPRGELFGPDRLHMNKEGYRLWRKVVAPYLR